MADVAALPVDPLTRFHDAVQQTPDRLAAVGSDGELTFAQLDQRVRSITADLVMHKVTYGDRVGIHLTRGTGLVVAMLAVWRAGAVYVPLDPRYPDSRLAQMAEQADIRTLISQPDPSFAPTTAQVVRPDSGMSDTDVLRAPTRQPRGLDLAYVIFTSGSTGAPKGIEVTRGAVASLIHALEQANAYASAPRIVAWNASASFDASVQQWVRVCRGDTVVVLDEQDRMDPARLEALLDRYEVTDLDLTPSHWELLRERLLLPRSDGRRLRIFMGGEPVPPSTWREIVEAGPRGGPEALNLYGPSECTVDSAMAIMSGGKPHIGRALPSVQLNILDQELHPVGEGVAGELYIAGPQLARGYVGQPGMTAERFIANPFGEPGSHMYRSGDLVRRTPKGDLEFLGRSDRQVKLRGYRVELSEIEFVLRSHASIATAAVVMHETGLLAAYCVPAAQTNLDTRVLHEHAVRMLPEFMVPSSYALLDKLPLTLNGKLDVRALPPPKDIPKPEARMPESDCEKLIAAVWSEVLGKETVTADDDFFALGAHSLMALRVVGRIKKRFGVKLSVTDAYRYSRLADLAKYVAELRE